MAFSSVTFLFYFLPYSAALLRKFRNERVLFVVHDFGATNDFDGSVAEVLAP